MPWDISSAAAECIDLPCGTLRYRDVGHGHPVVFLHGAMVNGNLWKPVVSELRADFRCLVPDWPLGSHSVPLARDADLTPPGLCDMLLQFLDELGLEQVVLVGNDTGGATCQLAVARFPERIAKLVLTPSDAYEVFPPEEFRYLAIAACVPGVLWLLSRVIRWRTAYRSPLGYGLLTKTGFTNDLARSFLDPGRNSGIRRDLRKVILGVSNRYTLEASRAFASYPCPVLIVWARANPVFPETLARRLAEDFPSARLVVIEDSYTYLPYDRPKQLAEAIRAFALHPSDTS